MPKLAQLLKEAKEQHYQELIQDLTEFFETTPKVLESIKADLRLYLQRISYYID